jgi:hypothetical protein
VAFPVLRKKLCENQGIQAGIRSATKKCLLGPLMKRMDGDLPEKKLHTNKKPPIMNFQL